MALSDTIKAAAAFKILFGKTHTQTANELANESEPAYVQLAGQQIFGDEIDELVPNTTVTDLIVATLTLISTSNGLAYQAYYPVGHAKAGQKVSNVVGQAYGDVYRPILKKAGVEVPPLDVADWFVTLSSGIVTSRVALALSTTGTLTCYAYKGNTLNDRLANLGSSITSNQPGVTYSCDDDVVVGDVVAFVSARKVGKLPINTSREALGIVKEITGALGARQALVLADDNEMTLPYTVSGSPGQRVFLQSDGSLGLAMPSASGSRVWQIGILSDTTHLHVQTKLVKVNA